MRRLVLIFLIAACFYYGPSHVGHMIGSIIGAIVYSILWFVISFIHGVFGAF